MKKCYSWLFTLAGKDTKIWLIMRLSFLFYAITLLQVNASVYSQKLNLDLENVRVQQVLRQIQQQSDYDFVFKADLLRNQERVSVSFVNSSIEEVMEQILPDYLDYEITDQTIIIKKKIYQNTDNEDDVSISGTITDTDGEPLPGATVTVKGSTEGTITDIDGKYSLTVPDNATIVISFVGFIQQEIAVGRRLIIDVTLEADLTTLSEVVVVGYGIQERQEVSSAISSVEAKSVTTNLGGNTSFDRGLSGMVKGVQIIQGSGQPGTGIDINIRGVTSPFAGADNNPLFVIDGVPFQTNPTFTFNDENSLNDAPNPLLTINPNDIESIDVLKDASATAIYGSRGANGVIIVNTKRGKNGEQANVTLNYTTTFAKPINEPQYLNTAQFRDRAAQILETSVAFSNANPVALDAFTVNGFSDIANVPVDLTTFMVSYEGLNEDYFGSADVNWADEVYRDHAITNQYNVTLTGGSTGASYGLSLGYTDQEGLLRADEFDQYNFRASLDTDLSKAISAGFSTNLSYSDNRTGYNNINSDLNSEIVGGRPDIAPRDENGQFNYFPSLLFGFFQSNAPNPLAFTTGHDFNTQTFSFLGNTYVEIEPVENLKIRSDVNVGRFSNDISNFSPSTVVSTIIPDFGANGTSDESSLNTSTTVNTNVISNLTAYYSTIIGDNHSLSILVGSAWDRSQSVRSSYSYQGFPDDNTLTNASVALETLASSQGEVETGLNSFFSRVSYNYDQRYFLTVNFRTDKSVKFGPDNQRGYFPSVAASWNLANESFLDGVELINNLRLRAGYGQSGSNNINDFAYLQFWNVGTRAEGLYNGGLAVGLNRILPNEEVRWETTTEINVGLDFGLLNNRVRGSVDYYNRETEDALMTGLYPLESGATEFVQNFADLTNKGFEIDLFGDVLTGGDVTWSLGFNIAKNTNTLDEFNAAGISPFISRFYEVGREVNIIRGYVTDGIIQTQDELDALNAGAPDGFYQEFGTAPGDYKYVDLDGDGEITAEDQQYLGSAQPDFFGGFSSLVSYKGLDLTANFTYSVGGEATISADGRGHNNDPYTNVETRYLDRWTPENPNATYPRAVVNDVLLNRNQRTSSALVHSTSFLRLQAVQLRYNLPYSIVSKAGIARASVSITGTNLWTSTDFPGIDPSSVGAFASAASIRTRDPYPIAKSLSFGLNVNF